jgi:hypothetical protein
MSEYKEPLHLHRIHPIIFGGDPNDEGNITFVPRLKHAELSTFWNKKIIETTPSGIMKDEGESKHDSSKLFPISIEFAELYFRVDFPKEFRAHLQSINGVQSQSLVLWGLDEMVQLNVAYHVEYFAPDLILIGSDGAEDAFAFERSTMHIVRVPFIGMGYIAGEKIADSFADFLAVYPSLQADA